MEKSLTSFSIRFAVQVLILSIGHIVPREIDIPMMDFVEICLLLFKRFVRNGWPSMSDLLLQAVGPRKRGVRDGLIGFWQLR